MGLNPLSLRKASTSSIISRIDAGLPYRSLRVLTTNSGLSEPSVAKAAGIPPRTLARRKAEGRFSPSESERVIRIALVFDKALALFEGDTTAAVRWFTAPRPALGGESPLAYCRTEVGAREVENLIGRLEHGVFS